MINTVEVTAARPLQSGRSVDVRPEIDVGVEGMTCASCVSRVERAICKVPGVADVAVNLGSKPTRIVFTDQVDPVAVKRPVEKARYELGAFAKAIRDHDPTGLPARSRSRANNYPA